MLFIFPGNQPYFECQNTSEECAINPNSRDARILRDRS